MQPLPVSESDSTPALEGARIPITPKHRGNLGATFQLPWYLDFTAHAIFVDERIVANDFQGVVEKLDWYARLDLLLGMAQEGRLGEGGERGRAAQLQVRTVELEDEAGTGCLVTGTHRALFGEASE